MYLYGRIILEILKQVDIKAIHLDRYLMDVLQDNGLLPLQKEFIECPHCHEQIHTVPWHIVKQCPTVKKIFHWIVFMKTAREMFEELGFHKSKSDCYDRKLILCTKKSLKKSCDMQPWSLKKDISLNILR